MKLLIGTDNGRTVWREFTSSFVVLSRQSLPVVLGVEYVIPEGVVRTFAGVDDSDFYDVLQRSSVLQPGMEGITYGVSCLLCTPFLGKGVPEWLPNVSRVLAVNTAGKYLFLTVQHESGKFETAVYGDPNFDQMLRRNIMVVDR